MMHKTTIRIIKLFPIVILTALPSLAFSQSFDIVNSESGFYQSDPFANYILSTDNPCSSKRYINLRNMSQDEMSKQESALFKQQSQQCRDYVSAIVDSKPEQSINVSSEDPNPLRPYFIIGACATVIAVGIVIAV